MPCLDFDDKLKALTVVAAPAAVPTVVLDALYSGFGFNPSGIYCGEPKCDPGPIPMSGLLILLPAALTSVALGVVARSLRVSGSLWEAPVMHSPPPEVMTAILRGGPYDGLVFEIEEGQTEISPKPLRGSFTGPPPPAATYKYGGTEDDGGNAIFGLSTD